MTPAERNDVDELPPVLRASLVAATAAYAAGVNAERVRIVAALRRRADRSGNADRIKALVAAAGDIEAGRL